MSQKTGRNEPCPCGSGKKYKRCCLERDDEARREMAQQRLWDDNDAPEEADSLDDGDVLDDDEPLAFEADDVLAVRYSRGMVKSLNRALSGRGLPMTEWLAPAIPREILESLEREAFHELDGTWGDPKAGDPIQVDIVEVNTSDD